MDGLGWVVKQAFRIGVAAAMVLVTSSAWAQVAASIGGTVKDASGGVLPGVTVEASSPALIEKSRSVVTDAQGNYKIVELRPGMYTVTFGLSGFSTVKREGIDLSAGFAATVNADLTVGSLAETITVSGASPVVDTQQSRNQQVLKTDTMNALPSGAQNTMAFAAMTLGAVTSTRGLNDVGGDKGEQATGIILHGGRGDDSRNDWDGMNVNPFFGGAGGTQRIYYFNTAAIQEVVIETGGASAETETGGANVNMVPREGSNTFRFSTNAAYTGQSLSDASVQDYLKARGVSDQTSLKKIWDYSLGGGGPIKKDKIWFYATSRWWGAQNYGANNYFNKSTNPLEYVPDTSRRAYTDQYYNDVSLRITWQPATKHKINQEEHQEAGCSCWLSIGGGALQAPEASTDYNYGPQILSQTTWSFTATNKLLIQAGMSFMRQDNSFVNGTALNKNIFTGYGTPTFPGPDIHSITELTTGYTYGALVPSTATYSKRNNNNNYNQKIAVSYITGSHAFKAGLRTLQGNYDFTGLCCGVSEISYIFQNGAPNALTQWAGPFLSQTRLSAQALYAQDQWAIKRLTLNLGVRYDHFSGKTLPVTVPAGPYTQERSVSGLDDLPNFKDIVPRLGAAYDLFGNGKTAIKVSFGKYLVGQGGGLSQQGFAPSVAILTNVTRTWNDTNGNFTPDCTLTNQAANEECGPGSVAFAQPISVLNLADDARRGWNNREYNYQTSIQLQEELRPGMAIGVGYFRTWWGNMTVTQNTAVAPADFTQYCITAPADPRIGPTSGQQICGLYAVNADKFGQVNYLVRNAEGLGLGTPQDLYNGVEVSLNWRWGQGALVNGGVSVGRETYDYCYANGHPELTPENFPVAYSSANQYPRTSQFCHVTSGWWDGIGSQAKAQVVYPLPYDINISGTWKTLPGANITSNYTLTAAQVAATSTLGRAPTGVSSVTYGIIPFGTNGSAQSTVFDHRLYKTDVRLSKVLKFSSRKLTGNFDIYNLFNSRVPQGINSTYSATNTFTLPTSLLGGRLFKFGATLDF